MEKTLFKAWGNIDGEFVCKSCAFKDSNNYDVPGALGRLKLAVTDSDASSVTKTVHQERMIHKTYNIMLPDTKIGDQVSGERDPTATELLVKMQPALLEDHVPLRVLGDGNCLFRAVSRGLYGSEDNHLILRLFTALEMAENPECYSRDHPEFPSNDRVKDPRVDIPPYQEALTDVCTAGTSMELLHIYATSAAIGKPVMSYYPGINEHLVAWNRRVTGRGVRDGPAAIKLLWSSVTVPKSAKSFQANHFVLLRSVANPPVELIDLHNADNVSILISF